MLSEGSAPGEDEVREVCDASESSGKNEAPHNVGGFVPKCHWRGCILRRTDGELCEHHAKAARFHGHIVGNPKVESDGWDGYSAWLEGLFQNHQTYKTVSDDEEQ